MICKNMFETSCTTKYVEKKMGNFVGDTGKLLDNFTVYWV